MIRSTSIGLLPAAVCLLLVCAAPTHADVFAGQALHDEEPEITRGAADAGRSRLLQRRAKKTQQRALEDVDVDSDWESQSPCKSIIALDGTRLLGHHKHDAFAEGEGVSVITDENMNFNGDVDIPFYEPEGVEATDEEFLCELDDGMTVPIQGTEDQMSELRTMLNGGVLVSAESTVEIERINIPDADGTPGVGDASQEVASLPPGPIRLINDGARNRERKLRRLNNPLEGVKKALVIRVTDLNWEQPPDHAWTISDKFFGTYGDTVTMASGFRDCTFGKLQFTSNYGSGVNTAPLTAPGVLDVTVGIRLNESTQATVRSAVVAAAQTKMGFTFPGPFDHVLILVKQCYAVYGESCSFAAYAYVNHWLSLYVGLNYRYPAVSMHELGHNLNLVSFTNLIQARSAQGKTDFLSHFRRTRAAWMAGRTRITPVSWGILCGKIMWAACAITVR